MTEPRIKPNWEKAVDQGLEICQTIDDDISEEAWNEAEDFFLDVKEQCAAVIETIERTKHVTDRQQKALDNWQSGVGNWIK